LWSSDARTAFSDLRGYSHEEGLSRKVGALMVTAEALGAEPNGMWEHRFPLLALRTEN
jgi:hypothetical protein